MICEITGQLPTLPSSQSTDYEDDISTLILQVEDTSRETFMLPEPQL